MPLLERGESLLVVVDAQPGFLEKLPHEFATGVVDRIRWLVALASRLGIPVKVTEEEPQSNGSTAPEIRAALPPSTQRHVKPTFGLAASPHIVADLEAETGRRTVVLVGLETDVCVAQSAIGLKESGWRVVVVSDAVASPGAGHTQGLDRLRDTGVELLGTKAVAYDWLRTVELAHEHLDIDDLASPDGVIL